MGALRVICTEIHVYNCVTVHLCEGTVEIDLLCIILHELKHENELLYSVLVKDVTRYMRFWLHSLSTHQMADRTVMK